MAAPVPAASQAAEEEFYRLQVQLQELKILNHDLAESNRRMHLMAQQGVDAAPAEPVPHASAMGKLFAAKASSSKDEVSAFGHKGFAHFKMFAAQGDKLLKMAEAELLKKPSAGEAAREARELAREESEAAALSIEVEALRVSLGAAMEELVEAKCDAKVAQQAAVEANKEEVSTPPPEAAPQLPQLPSAAQLRRRLVAARPDVWGKAEGAAAAVSDDLLAHAVAAVEAASARLVAEAPVLTPPPPSQTAASAEGADFMTQALLKIQKQQKDLEKMRETVDAQTAQIGRLAEQVSKDQKEAGDGAWIPTEVSRVPPEERLRAAEKQRQELGRRLEASEGPSRQLYELQCHLRVLADRLAQRNRALQERLDAVQEHREEQKLLRERLAVAQEDFRGSAPSRSSRATYPGPSTAPLQCDVGGAVAEGMVEADDASLRAPPASPPTPGAVAGRKHAEVQVDFAEYLAGAEGADVAAAAQGGAHGGAAGAAERLETLREELRQLRAEKATLAQRFACDAKDLRHAVRGKTSEGLSSSYPPEAPKGAAAHDACVPGSEAEASSVLYDAKITELEALNANLERDLALLGESEECLMDDGESKENLIASLMQQIRLAEDSANDGGSDAAADTGTAAAARRGVGILAAGAVAWLGGAAAWDADDAEAIELQRIAEEAMRDNCRLKADLRTLAQELRRALVEQAGRYGA